MSCSAKKLVYNGSLTQRGERNPLIPQGKSIELLEGEVSFHRSDGKHWSHPMLPCLHLSWRLWSPGGHASSPNWEEEGWIFLDCYYSMCAYPKVDIALHSGQTEEVYSWHRDTNIITWEVPVKQTSNLASYLINHRLPVMSRANHTPAPQDQGAGLSQIPVSSNPCLTVL